MRALYIIAIVFALVGCRSEVQPLAIQTVEQEGETLSLPALLADPAHWSGRRITLIAPLPTGSDGRVLVPFLTELELEASNATPGAQSGLWLAEPLPTTVAGKVDEGPNVLKLRGRLSPPGAYGTGGSFAYQFSAQSVSLLAPERTTLRALAENPRSLDGLVLEVEGSLLAEAEGAILAEEAAAGGVPSTAARQIKLRPTWDEAALEGLQQRGGVRYGRVVVLGWWQAGVLTPFSIRPA